MSFRSFVWFLVILNTALGYMTFGVNVLLIISVVAFAIFVSSIYVDYDEWRFFREIDRR